MRVIYNDDLKNLTVQEIDTITAIYGAVARDKEMIKKDFKLDPDDETFDGIDGLHLVPSNVEMAEMFIPCDDARTRVRECFSSGILDLSDCELSYDADDWCLY